MQTAKLLGALAALLPLCALATPHIPRSDAEILDRLPTQLNDAPGQELRRLRAAASPRNPDASAAPSPRSA